MLYVCRSGCPMSVEITDMTNCTLTDQVTIKYLPIQPLFKACHLDVNPQCSLFINSKFLDFHMIFHFHILDIKSIIFREARVFGKKAHSKFCPIPSARRSEIYKRQDGIKHFIILRWTLAYLGKNKQIKTKLTLLQSSQFRLRRNYFRGVFDIKVFSMTELKTSTFKLISFDFQQRIKSFENAL